MSRFFYGMLIIVFLCGAASGCRKIEANTPAGAKEDVSRPAPLSPASDAYPLTLTDDLGQTITLSQPPQRIISLAPSLTEILFALGLGDRVVGVTTYCHFPPEAMKKEKIGGYVNASHEKIVSLTPDLVFATRGTPRTFIEGLSRAGIPVAAVDQTSFAQILHSFVFIAQACGVPQKGEELAARLQRTREEISQKTGSLKPEQRPRALLVLSLQPLFVCGPGSFQEEMLEICGAHNVSGISQPFGPLSEEAVVEKDPQTLIFPSIDNGQAVTKNSLLATLQARPAWKNTTAVKKRRLIIINVDYLSVPGPRLEKGLRELAKQLHPELFGHE